jgi:hypothetical protein
MIKQFNYFVMHKLDHRIDTRPKVSLLCVLAWEKCPKFFTCYNAILEPMKNFRVHSRMASYDGVFGTSARRISDEMSSE